MFLENLKSKYDKASVARNHLDIAIELFFNNKSPVTIHLIASATFAILRDFPECKESELVKAFELIIKPGCEKEFYRQMNKHYNFFKHAKNDHDEVIDFDERATDLLILHCCLLLGLIDKKNSSYVTSFINWTYLFHPNLFNLPENVVQLVNGYASAQSLASLSREESKKIGRDLYQGQLEVEKRALHN